MITTFAIATIAAILCYIPIVCYYDWKYREFNPLRFVPLAVIGILATIVYLIDAPASRNFYLLGLTLILCGIVFAFALTGAIGGGDFLFASMIMLFVQYNPFRFPHPFFALDFFWTFAIFQVILVAAVLVYNFAIQNVPKEKTSFLKTMWYMMDTWPGKFPHAPNMIVISLAFVSTLAMELML